MAATRLSTAVAAAEIPLTAALWAAAEEQALVAVVADFSCPVPQDDLADCTGLSAQAARRTIRRSLAKGLLERGPDRDTLRLAA